MTTVSDVLNYLNTIAPPAMQEDWDNVGLLCGWPDKPVTQILVALDPFEAVCREAADWGAELIVTHHPLIFKPLSRVTDETITGRCVLFLASHGISAINAHTNLDCAPGGVNDVLAEMLGLSGVEVLNPLGNDAQGLPYGLLRAGTVKEQPLDAFLSQVKAALGCGGLRYVNSGRSVHRVAVGGGACASELSEVIRAGCDTFVTADVKYNQFWDACSSGLNLIDAGHFYTENPVCTMLAEKLQAAFPEIPVKISKKHSDCMEFFG